MLNFLNKDKIASSLTEALKRTKSAAFDDPSTAESYEN